MERKQLDRLQGVRARREATAIEPALTALSEAAARDDVNLMPPLLDAARARASEGEIVQALQRVFGAYAEIPAF